MELDLFTFVAQVVNFIVLVVLLRIFLYKPVIRAMDERERRIASRLAEAEEQRRKAEREGTSLREQREQLEEDRAGVLSDARRQAQERREELIAEARGEARRSRERWVEALERQKQRFLSRLRTRVGEETYRIARKALAELADEQLETRIVTVFGRRLDSLEGRRREEVAEALRDDGRVHITSAFPLTEEDRARLQERIRALAGGGLSFEYGESRELFAGVKLSAGDERISFSLESYLDELEARMREAIEEESENEPHG